MANQQFINAMLKSHNDFRKLHGSPPLKINQDLNKMAQAWAENLARRQKFEHSKKQQYKGAPVGENLAMKWTSNNLDYKGHFTQVVWHDSQELGVGKAQGRDMKWIVVAKYFPAGNYVGRYQENVVPPGSKPVRRKAPDAPSTTAPLPRMGQTSFTTTTRVSQPQSSGPRGWFSRRTSSPARTRQVPVQGASRPTFTTTVVTERNANKFAECKRVFSTQPPHSQTTNHSYLSKPAPPRPPPPQSYSSYSNLPSGNSQSVGYSQTVVTETVIRPDGTKTVTTKEVVKNISSPKGRFFNR